MPPFKNLELDAQRAVKDTVGWEGGALSTSDGLGRTYELVIPPGALLEDTEITLIPVTGLKAGPLEGLAIAGAHFLPEGLTFPLPAQLTVTFSSPPAASRLAGLSYEGDLANAHLLPVTKGDGKVTFPVFHFSGLAALLFEEMQDITLAPPTGAAAQAVHTIALELERAEAAGETPSTELLAGAMRAWFNATVKPYLQAAATANDTAPVMKLG